MKTLVIVESPTKAKTIEKFLGKQYTVKSCMGHIRDLPKSSFGVDVENDFAPHYITIRGKGDVIKTLKDESKKADRILLASDPDREGEAIAWHLQQYLEVKNPECRIRFNEITGEAVKKAVREPALIDSGKVEAQQARRILDRLVGYKLSPLLWKKIKKGLSAGRVQTVAVRLICDREQEILDFTAEEYWTVTAYLQAASGELVARLVKIDGAKAELKNRQQVEDLLLGLKKAAFAVSAVNVREKKKGAAPPFTTSTMQQEASRRLGLT
ncbi:MAG: DNA topoisomerase, partial [Clostridiales bacterium]|nr:DNA topoisomerase [Clostridiales bacterium]